MLDEHDPYSVTFDQVAAAAGVSRALVHTYLGDRRGLIDAVQVRIVGRLDARVAPSLARSEDHAARLRTLVGALFAFVGEEREGWGVLLASGGLDHPALHGVRARWAAVLADGAPGGEVAAQAAVAALLLGIGGWVGRGTEPGAVVAPLLAGLGAPAAPS
ncbi:TetR family transcriptional regulator [Aquihabitans sp. G128]|uniref:TetR/AcrR family transcriptional regulator n=1 Tax=Aquihabitans sp. G128 TaxID=2849779 RepID=UPI0020B42448